MFHSNTDALIGYWRSLSVGGRIPHRADFDPARVPDLLPQIFMLELGTGTLPFRLAGEFLIDLHGRPLRGVDFQTLFSTGGRRVVTQAALSALNSPEAAVLAGEGWSEEGKSVGLEIALAPLAGAQGRVERLVGLYQPTTLVARLAGKPVTEINARLASGEPGGHLKLVVNEGLRIA